MGNVLVFLFGKIDPITFTFTLRECDDGGRYETIDGVCAFADYNQSHLDGSPSLDSTCSSGPVLLIYPGSAWEIEAARILFV
jgi:hypothetical protein